MTRSKKTRQRRILEGKQKDGRKLSYSQKPCSVGVIDQICSRRHTEYDSNEVGCNHYDWSKGMRHHAFRSDSGLLCPAFKPKPGACHKRQLRKALDIAGNLCIVCLGGTVSELRSLISVYRGISLIPSSPIMSFRALPNLQSVGRANRTMKAAKAVHTIVNLIWYFGSSS